VSARIEEKWYDHEDLALVEVSAVFTDEPDITYADTLDGMQRLIDDFVARHAARHPDADWSLLDDAVAHESEHAAAAAALGCRSRFGLRVQQIPGNRCWVRPVHSCVSDAPLMKLAVAAMAAAPANPSEGDIEYLHDLGYAGVADVAGRILAYNKYARKPIPVPVSAALATVPESVS
jgi:hypothetical protein